MRRKGLDDLHAGVERVSRKLAQAGVAAVYTPKGF
jgi:hypothetical protein